MISARDEKYFKLAKEASELATWQPEKIGAVIVLRNEVIGVGYNRNKPSTDQFFWAKKAGRPEAVFTHAEVSALAKVDWSDDLDMAKIYVSRSFKDGSNAIARPCEICTMALKHYGIKNIFYTTNDGFVFERWE
jgi:tRNA(Arg) A34 adenosine deaminase TadA